MKILKNECKSHLRSLEIDPEKMVETIISKGVIENLICPTPAKNIKCPMCGGTLGFYIPYDKTWSCLRNECISLNAPKNESGEYVPPKLTMKCCGVPEDFLNANFENCDHPKEIINSLRAYCKNFKGFLLLTGPSGRGKSYGASVCVNEFLKRDDNCFFIEIYDLYFEWLNATQGESNLLSLMDKYVKKTLLVIDDLGSRKPSDAFLEFIQFLITKRSNSTSLSTVISTNLNSRQILEQFGNPILSRISKDMIIKYEGDKIGDRRRPKF